MSQRERVYRKCYIDKLNLNDINEYKYQFI